MKVFSDGTDKIHETFPGVTVCLILQGDKMFNSLCFIIEISSTLLVALEIFHLLAFHEVALNQM